MTFFHASHPIGTLRGGPDGGTRLSVGSGDWVVDIDEDSRLVAGVDTRDGDERSGSAGATVGDLDLGAADVELHNLWLN